MRRAHAYALGFLLAGVSVPVVPRLVYAASSDSPSLAEGVRQWGRWFAAEPGQVVFDVFWVMSPALLLAGAALVLLRNDPHGRRAAGLVLASAAATVFGWFACEAGFRGYLFYFGEAFYPVFAVPGAPAAYLLGWWLAGLARPSRSRIT